MEVIKIIERSNRRRRYNWGTVALRTFRDEIYRPKAVLYPYSSTHVTPATVFGRDSVTFLDSDSLSIAKLQEAGLKTAHSDVRAFDPKGEKYDLMLFLQPELGTRHVIPHLTDKGYVLTNVGDYSAEELLFEVGGFALLGHMGWRTGKLSKNFDTILPLLRKSWEKYQQAREAFEKNGIDFEDVKRFFPSIDIVKTQDLRNILVLRKET